MAQQKSNISAFRTTDTVDENINNSTAPNSNELNTVVGSVDVIPAIGGREFQDGNVGGLVMAYAIARTDGSIPADVRNEAGAQTVNVADFPSDPRPGVYTQSAPVEVSDTVYNVQFIGQYEDGTEVLTEVLPQNVVSTPQAQDDSVETLAASDEGEDGALLRGLYNTGTIFGDELEQVGFIITEGTATEGSSADLRQTDPNARVVGIRSSDLNGDGEVTETDSQQYTFDIRDLDPRKDYVYQAYGVRSTTTPTGAYERFGQQRSFRTVELGTVPQDDVITTLPAEDISSDRARLVGDWQPGTLFGDELEQFGFFLVESTAEEIQNGSPNDNLNNDEDVVVITPPDSGPASDVEGGGRFEVFRRNLSPNTFYRYQAFGRRLSDQAYEARGLVVNFATLEQLPEAFEIRAVAATNVDNDSATLNAIITNNTSADVQVRYFARYATQDNYDPAEDVINNPTDSQEFFVTVPGGATVAVEFDTGDVLETGAAYVFRFIAEEV